MEDKKIRVFGRSVPNKVYNAVVENKLIAKDDNPLQPIESGDYGYSKKTNIRYLFLELGRQRIEACFVDKKYFSPGREFDSLWADVNKDRDNYIITGELPEGVEN